MPPRTPCPPAHKAGAQAPPPLPGAPPWTRQAASRLRQGLLRWGALPRHLGTPSLRRTALQHTSLTRSSHSKEILGFSLKKPKDLARRASCPGVAGAHAVAAASPPRRVRAQVLPTRVAPLLHFLALPGPTGTGVRGKSAGPCPKSLHSVGRLHPQTRRSGGQSGGTNAATRTWLWKQKNLGPQRRLPSR